MRGEVLVISEEHRKAGQNIATILLAMGRRKVVVAIGGESGAGKTAIAHVVSKTMKSAGMYAKVINLDNYYRVEPADRNEWRLEHGLESIGPEEYDWELIHRHVDAFLADGDAELPCVDILTDQVDTLRTTFKGIPFLILDGLYPLLLDADVKIHLDSEYNKILRAQELRGKEKLDEFRMEVLKREHEATQKLRRFADFILTKEFELVEQKRDTHYS